MIEYLSVKIEYMLKYIFYFGFVVFLLACESDFDKKRNTFTTFKGGDSRISLQGRFELTDSTHPKVWAPGAYFELFFDGPFCEVNITDEHKYYLNHNYIEVILDNKKSKRIRLKKAHNKILIGEFLKDTIHHLLVCKNTESGIGYIQLNHVTCRKLLPNAKKKTRLIEFIGNSITCGNGSDSSQIKFGDGKWYDYHSAYKSYGVLIARRFNANWILSSVSGIGLTRNCCKVEHTMPQVYHRIAFDQDSPIWKFPTKKPDVLCVTLGQNDGIQKEQIYEDTYVRFLKSLRKRYPKTTIICCSSQMANNKLKVHLEKCISKVIKRMNVKNDKNVFSFFYSRSYTSGYAKHPTLSEHKLIAIELGDYIQKIKGW